jgi:hypothetical protein
MCKSSWKLDVTASLRLRVVGTGGADGTFWQGSPTSFGRRDCQCPHLESCQKAGEPCNSRASDIRRPLLFAVFPRSTGDRGSGMKDERGG